MENDTIQRLADARNCLEGKIVAVALSLLMALLFLNVSVFADAALAVEGFDGEVGEKTTEQMPLENDPEKTSESVSTPTNDGASETPWPEGRRLPRFLDVRWPAKRCRLP